jgi:hypothetical protein
MSSLKRFLAHLNEPRPKFECEAAGGSKKRHIEVPISHNLGSPAKAAELALLRKLLGRHAKQVQALYCLHDGLELYGQSDSGELIFHPIHSWSKATSELRREHKDSGRGDDEIHEFERKGVVFGEPAGSGNHLILHQGKVYYANHDGGDDEPLADSFDGLLDRIVADPARFLYELGCYARYSDGRTGTQWIPMRYFSPKG